MNPALGLLLLLLHLHVVVLDVAGHWRCYKTVLVVVCWWWRHRHLMKVRRRLEVLLIHGGRNILDWILPERPMLLTTSHVRLRPDRLLETHLLLLLWRSRGLPRLIGASDTRTTDITLTYAT